MAITIKSLEVQSPLGDVYVQSAKNFLSACHSKVKNMVHTNSLIVGKYDFQKYIPNEEELANLYQYDSEIQIKFNVGGYHREVFGSDSIIFELPCIKGGEPIDMNEFNLHILLPLVRDGRFDDEYFMFIKAFLDVFPLYYNRDTGAFGYNAVMIRNHLRKNDGSADLNYSHLKDVTNQELLELEVSQGFTSKTLGDPARGHGFTHKIRELLNMKFFTWQKHVVLFWNKVNVIFAVRNTGKTAFACYIGLREIVSDKTGYGIRKNRKIIYFVPDKVDIGEQIMDYMEGYIDSIFDSAVLQKMEEAEYLNASEVQKEELRYMYQEEVQKLKRTYFKIDRSKYSVRFNITGNSLKVVSLQDVIGKDGKGLGTSKGEGLACDVYIIEEAPRIPDMFWNSFWERAETESEYGYISGTLNKETPKNHWAYKLGLRGQLGDPNISTHRVTLAQNENLFMKIDINDAAAKKEIIERERLKLLESGMRNLYSRGYGIILDESKVFNVSGSVITEVLESQPYHYRVIIEDFGGDSDPIGYIVYNINTMCVEKAVRYKGLSPVEQLKLLQDDKAFYKNCYTLGDGTGFGRMVRTIDVDGVVEYYITFSSGPEWKYNKEKGYYAVDKAYMVELLKDFFDKNFIKIPAIFQDLLDDIENFVRLTSANAKVQQYAAKQGKTDDLVACLLMLAVFITKALGLIDKKEFESFGINLESNQDEIYNLVMAQQGIDSNTSTFYNGMY